MNLKIRVYEEFHVLKLIIFATAMEENRPVKRCREKDIAVEDAPKKKKTKFLQSSENDSEDSERVVENSSLYQWAISTTSYAEWLEKLIKVF